MKTFFRPEMNVSGNNSFSPSAGKPEKLIKYLIKNNLELSLVENFEQISREDFYLAHDKEFVTGILDLKTSNGFNNRSAEVARSLPYTTGSFYAAAEYALRNKENAFSPTSGFHHAGFKNATGFCTFNSLMVTALKLKNLNLIEKVGIIDCDTHYGDGTENIIKRKSIDWIRHYTFGEHGIRPSNAEQWLNDFKAELEKYKSMDIIFYQAGADPHINDPLGGSLTTEQMLRRDELVFKTFSKLGIPVVWNLAGGYQDPIEKVLDLHKTTYEIALKYTAVEIVSICKT
jgi:acetoin utilization deacetylase AcuC-like enzyme